MCVTFLTTQTIPDRPPTRLTAILERFKTREFRFLMNPLAAVDVHQDASFLFVPGAICRDHDASGKTTVDERLWRLDHAHSVIVVNNMPARFSQPEWVA
jgi:hypothetical protein